MKCELTVDLPVHRLLVFAELAWLEPRPELGHLCRAASKTGRIESATIEQALRGISPAGAKNLLAHCHYLGLCGADGTLTDLGREVAQSNYAPVPEQGVFRFWAATHPLLGGVRLLHVERMAPEQKNKSVPSESVPLPLRLPKGRSFGSVIDPAQRFVLIGLPSNNDEVRCMRESDVSCRLSWRIDFAAGTNQWQLTGTFPVDGGSPLQHTPESAKLDLAALQEEWGTRALSEHGRWHKGRLLVPWLSVAADEAAQESFLRDHRLKQVAVPGLGEYRDVVLQSVPLGPAAQADAGAWAWARLSRQLRRQPGYQTRQALVQRFREDVAKTPLAAQKPVLPAHADLLRAADKEPRLLFQLAAAVDLAPVPAAPELLTAQPALTGAGAA